MTRYLVKQCKYCNNIIRIKMEDDKVVEVIGGEQYPLTSNWKYINGKWIANPSNKTILCSGSNGKDCLRENKVSKFTEIIP